MENQDTLIVRTLMVDLKVSILHSYHCILHKSLLPSSSTLGPCKRLGACLVSPKSGLLRAGASSGGTLSLATSYRPLQYVSIVRYELTQNGQLDRGHLVQGDVTLLSMLRALEILSAISAQGIHHMLMHLLEAYNRYSIIGIHKKY